MRLWFVPVSEAHAQLLATTQPGLLPSITATEVPVNLGCKQVLMGNWHGRKAKGNKANILSSVFPSTPLLLAVLGGIELPFQAKLWKHCNSAYTLSPWPNAWSPRMAIFCLAECQQTSAEATWVARGHLRGLLQESKKNSWIRDGKPTPVGKASIWMDSQLKAAFWKYFLLVLIKINWSYLEFKKYTHTHTNPMYMWRGIHPS